MKFSAEHLPFLLLLLGGLTFSIGKKKLSLAGAITGALCGILIYLGCGYTGFLLLTAFFLLGTVATSMGRKRKQHLEKRDDTPKRNYRQVLANAGMGTTLALLAILNPAHAPLYQFLLAVSMASATADTLSSELGMIWGRQYYNCISWKKEAKGLDGVISLQGTLAGIAGAAIIALLFVLLENQSAAILLLITAGGAIGSHVDSIIGATLERKKLLHNDAVNFLSTLIAVFCALLIILLSQCAIFLT